MSTNAILLYKSIEDYLGSGEQRFFGKGYRRAEYRFGDISVTLGDEGNLDVQAKLSVVYPHDWSVKADQIDLRPHLSSIDTLVIGAQLSEIYLAHAYGFDKDARRNMRLRKVILRAGSTPEENLIDIPLVAKLRTTKPLAGDGDRCISTIDCQAGLMRARCEIEHQIAPRVNTTGVYRTVEEILGSPTSRYYGEGFKARKQRIEDVQVDMEMLRSDARVHVEAIQEEGMHSGTEGMNGQYQPSVSMIDCFVVLLQMTQVMMYELDAVRRQDSNTLWMIQTVLEEVVLPDVAADAQGLLSVDAQSTIRGKHLLPLHGSVWRNLDIVGHCGGITMQSSIAHALPSSVQA